VQRQQQESMAITKTCTHTYPSNVCEKYFSVFAISAPEATGKIPFIVREW